MDESTRTLATFLQLLLPQSSYHHFASLFYSLAGLQSPKGSAATANLLAQARSVPASAHPRRIVPLVLELSARPFDSTTHLSQESLLLSGRIIQRDVCAAASSQDASLWRRNSLRPGHRVHPRSVSTVLPLRFYFSLNSRPPLSGLIHQPSQRRHALQVFGALQPVTVEAIEQGAIRSNRRGQACEPACLLYHR